MMMKLVLVASLAAMAFAMKCNDCTQYCKCTSGALENVAKPSHDAALVKAALDKCNKTAPVNQSEAAVASAQAIADFFECRNAHCVCAKKIDAAVGIALGVERPIASPEAGESRRKRSAQTKAAGARLLKCLAEELNCDEPTLATLLNTYKKHEEVYLMCFEDSCDVKNNKMISEEAKCSRRAGFEAHERKSTPAPAPVPKESTRKSVPAPPAHTPGPDSGSDDSDESYGREEVAAPIDTEEEVTTLKAVARNEPRGE